MSLRTIKFKTFECSKPDLENVLNSFGFEEHNQPICIEIIHLMGDLVFCVVAYYGVSDE